MERIEIPDLRLNPPSLHDILRDKDIAVIPSEEICMGEVLGRGAMGVVVKATWSHRLVTRNSGQQMNGNHVHTLSSHGHRRVLEGTKSDSESDSDDASSLHQLPDDGGITVAVKRLELPMGDADEVWFESFLCRMTANFHMQKSMQEFFHEIVLHSKLRHRYEDWPCPNTALSSCLQERR